VASGVGPNMQVRTANHCMPGGMLCHAGVVAET
jgi:hypothetical protein